MDRVAGVVSVLLLCASGLCAQRAPVPLEPGHWTWDAIRRLDAAGLAPPASDPSEATVTLRHAHAVFAHASREAERLGRLDLAGLARGYAAMLGPNVDDATSIAILNSARIDVGWASSARDALGGEGYFVGEDFTGAELLDVANGPGFMMSGHGYPGSRLSWSARGGYISGAWILQDAVAGAAIGPFDVWGGRRRLHYGAGRGGAIVAGSGFGDLQYLAHRTLDRFDGVGIGVREPFEFPSFLNVLGASRFEIAGGRLDRNGRIESPWIVFGRLTMSPFSDRLTLGVNRGAIFGGDGNDITFRRLLGLLVGEHNAGFENQVFSGLMRYRPPLGGLPLSLYVEVGIDDTAGSLTAVPTYIAGFDVAALPGLATVSLGIEHARYSGSCCGNPQWYRNVFFRGSWSDDGRLFAHPLGGHGYEWLATTRVDMPARGMLMRVQAFTRWRGHENLFAPERAGYSNGGSFSFELHRRTVGLHIEADIERAADWDRYRLAAMISREWR